MHRPRHFGEHSAWSTGDLFAIYTLNWLRSGLPAPPVDKSGAGAGATLRLDTETGQVGGTIGGFGLSDHIDLSFLAFSKATKAVWVENGAGTGGTRRRHRYLGNRPRAEISGHTAIVIDDGHRHWRDNPRSLACYSHTGRRGAVRFCPPPTSTDRSVQPPR